MNPHAQTVLSESESFYLPRPRLDITYGAHWAEARGYCFTCGSNPCTCDPHARNCGCDNCLDIGSNELQRLFTRLLSERCAVCNLRWGQHYVGEFEEHQRLVADMPKLSAFWTGYMEGVL